MVELEVQKVGDAIGIVFPDEVADRLQAGEGARLVLLESPDGGYHIVPVNGDVARKLARAEGIIDRYRSTLRRLAQ